MGSGHSIPMSKSTWAALAKTQHAASGRSGSAIEAMEPRRLLAGYAVTDLQTLGYSSHAGALNDTGQVVGTFYFSNDSIAHDAFLYSGGRMTDLDSLETDSLSVPISEGYGVNTYGLAVGFTYLSGNNAYAAFMYARKNGMVSLGKLSADSSYPSYSKAYGVNDFGQAVGSSGGVRSGRSFERAFLYNGGPLQDLGTLGGTQSQALAINNGGQVVGWSFGKNNAGPYAFTYSDGTMTPLPTLGGKYALATAINASGQIAGVSSLSSGGQHAFIYSNGWMSDLGILAGQTRSQALGINDAGQVVGDNGVATVGAADGGVFLYSGGRLQDLSTLLPPGTPWTLRSAVDINNRGQIAVTASNPAGIRHALLLTPVVMSNTTTSFSPAVAVAGNGNVTLAASVTAANRAIVNEGIVSFNIFLAGRLMRTVTGSLAGGWATAVLPLSGLEAGGYDVRVTYSDTGSYSAFYGSNSIAQSGLIIQPGAPSRLFFSSQPSSGIAGAPLAPVSVQIKDAFDNKTTDNSLVTMAVASGPGTLGGTVTVRAQNGIATFSNLTLKTAGTYVLRATDGGLTPANSGTITVIPAAPAALSVSGFTSPAIAGVAQVLTVTVRDPYGNVVKGYTGTVHFTSSDPQAVLPADYRFGASDIGMHSFSGVSFKTVGTHSITASSASNTSINGTQSGIVVNSAPAARLDVVRYLPSSIAGRMQRITIVARDSYGNVATDYRGTVHFTSTDPQAVLPADYSFVAGDKGLHTFDFILKTVGTHSISFRDVVADTINGTQSGIVANSAPAATLDIVESVFSTVAGRGEHFTIVARDSFGNVATGYTGTVHFTSTDGHAVLPADYSFTAGDKGFNTFDFTLKTAGIQSITIRDVVTDTMNVTQSSIGVNHAAAAALSLSGFASPAIAGAAQGVDIVVRDRYSNVASGYTGTVHFTSSDAEAMLPADYTFGASDLGLHSFTGVRFNTPGTHSITATDTVTGTINGTQRGIIVNLGTTDTVAPSISLISPDSDSISSNATPTFSGAGGFADGDSGTVTVQVYAGGSASGTSVQTLMATCNTSTGAYSVAAPGPIADGIYTVQVSQSDDAGNIGLSAATTFTIDTVAPAVTLTSPPNGSSTSNASPTFSGIASVAGNDSAMVMIQIYVGDSASGTPAQTLSTTRDTSTGAYSVAAPNHFADGTYTVQASQSDAAGNNGFSAANTFTIEEWNVDVPPTVTLAVVDGSADEAGTHYATVRFARIDGDISKPLNVRFSNQVPPGTATYLTDYFFTNESSFVFQIPAGQKSADLIVRGMVDNVVEGDETIRFQLSPNAEYAIGSSDTADITIEDETDEPLTVTLAVIDGSADEAGTHNAVLRFERTGGDITKAVDIRFSNQVPPGTATYLTDYFFTNESSFSIQIPAGQSYFDLFIRGVIDDVVEGDEAIHFQITANADYAIGANGSADISIIDDTSSNLA
jgi:probable HAF family extracellular repeat protein